MERSERDFGDFVERLYGGVHDGSDDWTPALEALCRLVGGTHAQFFAGRISDPGGPSIRSFHGADAGSVSDFLETAGRTDPRIPLFLKSRGRVVRDRDIEPEDFETHPIVRDYLDPLQIRRMIGLSWSPDGDQLATLAALRSRAQGEFDAAEAGRFETLSSHMLRAYNLRRHMAEARRLRQSVADILMQSPRAALLLDASGATLIANEPAEALAREGLLSGQTGRLTFPDPAAMRELDAARADARSAGSAPARLFMVRCAPPGSDRVRRLVARVLPLPAAHPFRAVVDARATVAVYLGEVDAPPSGAGAFHPEVLIRLFGLSPHEARLAVHLGSGQSLDQAAEVFGVARNTVRAQLQSTFAKTETNRQAELVHLVQRLASLFH